MKVVDIRCPECNKTLFKIIDDRYIEINCTRCKAKKLTYDLKKSALTKNKFPDRLILG
ncbi:MAG: hypothetical protein ACOC80_16415 [Petrotogales bacterium]